MELPHLCCLYSYSIRSSNSSRGHCSQLSQHTPHEFQTRSAVKAYQFQDNRKGGKKIEHRFPNPLIQKWSPTSVSNNRIASIQIRTSQKGDGKIGGGTYGRSQIEHLCSQFRLAPRVQHHRPCDPRPWWLSAVEYIHDDLFGKCRSRREGYAS